MPANIFHRWWNPHCPDCRDEEEKERHNPTIEILQSELDRITRANERLLAQLIAPAEPIKRETTKEIADRLAEMKPVRQSIPWRVRQQMLEEDDRVKARILKEQKIISENDLDKELESLKSNG